MIANLLPKRRHNIVGDENGMRRLFVKTAIFHFRIDKFSDMKVNKSPGTCSEKLCHRFVDCLTGPVRITSAFSRRATARARLTFFGNGRFAPQPQTDRLRIGAEFDSYFVFTVPPRVHGRLPEYPQGEMRQLLHINIRILSCVIDS